MAYLARRIALGFLTLWLISLAAFLLLRIAPGDAVTAAVARSPGEGGLAASDIEQLREELGLNRPWLAQYLDWLGDALRLDPGRSLATDRSVWDEGTPCTLRANRRGVPMVRTALSPAISKRASRRRLCPLFSSGEGMLEMIDSLADGSES